MTTYLDNEKLFVTESDKKLFVTESTELDEFMDYINTSIKWVNDDNPTTKNLKTLEKNNAFLYLVAKIMIKNMEK